MADNDNVRLGRKMIESALKMQDSLAELLSVQVLHMRKLAGGEIGDEIVRANILLRNIIMTLMLLDENYTRGLNLCGVEPKID